MIQEYFKRSFIFLILALASKVSIAASSYGVNFSYPVYSKEPTDLKGFQLMLNFDPNCPKWHGFNIYFDGGFSHFWVDNVPYHTTLNIYSIAPVARYYFNTSKCLRPYFEISIGIAYLNHTRLENRNLGIHFAFQDRLGVGTTIGRCQQFSLGLHAVHYSNAHLSEHNSGITIPLVLDLGYRF